MGYERLNLKTGQVITEEVFTHLEDGIEGASVLMTPILYADLVVLRNAGQLKAGMFYRITDYVTTTLQENTQSAGHAFDVIVMATDNKTLSEEARACKSEFDIEKYKDANCNTSGVKMLYVGLFSYDGKNYHLYEADDHTIQMLVDFNVETSVTLQSGEYPYSIYPSYIRRNNEGQWNEWYYGIDEGENIAFKHNTTIASYFKDSNLAAWKVWYCLDNDSERFAWADAENGKGVIYRLIDEWNNDCPYDFKNIQFKRGIYADGGGIEREEGDGDHNVYCYTFSWEDDEREIMDASLVGNNGYILDDTGQIMGVYGNVVKEYVDYTGENENPRITQQFLNNIVFLSTYGYEDRVFYGYHSNSFGNDCYSNSFGNLCYSNSFGNGCYSNSFGNDCCYNSFGNGCCYNSLDEVSNATILSGVDNKKNIDQSYVMVAKNSQGEVKVFNIADLVE